MNGNNRDRLSGRNVNQFISRLPRELQLEVLDRYRSGVRSRREHWRRHVGMIHAVGNLIARARSRGMPSGWVGGAVRYANRLYDRTYGARGVPRFLTARLTRRTY